MIKTLEGSQVDRWLSALADPTRRRIVEMLSESPQTATEIHHAFPIAGPAVSRHLRVLRDASVIVHRQVPTDKRVRLYTLAEDAMAGLSGWLQHVESGAAWGSQLGAFQDYVALRQRHAADTPAGRSR